MGAGQSIKGGKLFSATGGKGRSSVAREDCARAAARALVQAQGSEILDVTGGAAVTQDELAAMLSEVSGQPVVHLDVPPQGLTEGLSHAGLPPHLVKVIVDFDGEASQGYHALVTPTVQRLTGASPLPLKEFLGKHLATA